MLLVQSTDWNDIQAVR